MFCCERPTSKYDPVDTTMKQKSVVDTEYPASRRPTQERPSAEQRQAMNLVQTGGNALMVYDPETMSDLIKVVVPPDCYPGQMIQVTAPDDSNRVANVIIPRHCNKPGTSFLVQLPPIGSTTATTITPHDLAFKEDTVDTFTPTKIEGQQQDLLRDDIEQEPLKEKLLNQDDRDDNMVNNSNNNGETMMLICVPPGVDSGTTIYATIPGNDKRYLPVKVPKGGVSQFYVSYVYGHTISEHEMNEQHKREKEKELREKQNWHDNPIAYGAPMLALPLLS